MTMIYTVSPIKCDPGGSHLLAFAWPGWMFAVAAEAGGGARAGGALL